MLKFISGEREFTKGQVVYFLDSYGTKWNIKFGVVDDYWGYGDYCLNIYAPPEAKMCNGVETLMRVDGFNFDTPEGIKSCIDSGKLTLGVERHWDRGTILEDYVKVNVKDIFHFYAEAKAEADKRNEPKPELSDYDYSVAEVNKALTMCRSDVKEKVWDYIKEHNLQDFDVFIGGGKVYVVNWTVPLTKFPPKVIDPTEDRYTYICDFKQKEISVVVCPEKYLIIIYNRYDRDKTPIIKKYTNTPWQDLVAQYKTDENVIEIIDKHPAEPFVGVSYSYHPAIDNVIEHYIIPQGSYDMSNGKLDLFDISLGSHLKIDNMGIKNFHDSKRDYKDIVAEVRKKLIKIVGQELADEMTERLEDK